MHSAMRKALVHPHTGLLLEPLGFRKDGRAIWPMLGAGPEEDKAAADAKAAEDKAAADKAAADAKANEKPSWYEGMSDEAKAEYDKLKGHSRKHEDLWKDLKKQADKDAAEVEKLRQAALTDHQREVEEAAKAAEQSTASRMAPKLLTAEFRVQLAEKGVKFDPAVHGTLLETFDATKFYGEDGEIDDKKVAAVVATIGPAGQQQQRREAPGVNGLGHSGRPVGNGNGVQAGMDRYEQEKSSKVGAGTARDWSR